MSARILQQQYHDPEGAPDLRAHLRPLWRRRWIVLLVGVVAAGGAYGIASRQPKEYVSTANVYISAVDPAAEVGTTPSSTLSAPTAQDMQDLATLFTADSVSSAVSKELGFPVSRAGSVTVTALEGPGSTTTSFLEVKATSKSPPLAARLASIYVAVFLAQRRAAQSAQAASDAKATQAELASIPDTPANASERQALATQYSQLQTVTANPSAGARQIVTALVPHSPSSPDPQRDAAIAGVVGLLFGVGLAFGLALLDRRLLRVSEIEASYGVPVLAVLPHVRRPTPTANGRALLPPMLIEPVRTLRIGVRRAVDRGALRTLLIASGIPGEGKSTVARDLALVHAEAGEAVLLIDADLRRGTMAKAFGVESSLGLVQLLRDETTLAEAVVSTSPPSDVESSENGRRSTRPNAHRAPRGRLDLIVSTEPVADPVSLLGSPAMKGLLANAVYSYDTVIIDSAPLLAVADTAPLLDLVDAVVLVARFGLTTRESAGRVIPLIARVSSAVPVGVVVNDARRADSDDGHKSYGYDFAETPRTAIPIE